MIFRKNDGLSQFLTEIDLQSLGHEDVQHLADGILVEYPLVQSSGSDLVCLR